MEINIFPSIFRKMDILLSWFYDFVWIEMFIFWYKYFLGSNNPLLHFLFFSTSDETIKNELMAISKRRLQPSAPPCNPVYVEILINYVYLMELIKW